MPNRCIVIRDISGEGSLIWRLFIDFLRIAIKNYCCPINSFFRIMSAFIADKKRLKVIFLFPSPPNLKMVALEVNQPSHLATPSNLFLGD